MSDYAEFLARKTRHADNSGFEPIWMPEFLFDFQQYLVDWSLMKGRAAIFADCGMGKTPMSLVWATNVHMKMNKRVLIVAPLAVSHQFVTEANKFGLTAGRSADGKNLHDITVTNYERLHYFDPKDFGGIVCDECFPPDTPVLSRNVATKDLFEKRICDIVIGDTIINAQGADYVTETHCRKINRAVRINAGGIITSSENHPFFTMYGWRRACDLQPGDYIMETAEAMRVLRRDCSSTSVYEMEKVLQSILLSEMEDDATGDSRQSTQRRGECENFNLCREVDAWRIGNSQEANRAHNEPEPDEQPDYPREGFCDVTGDESQTFRAWWKRKGNDEIPEVFSGCTIREMDSGVCYISGKINRRISELLQGGYCESFTEDSNRGGREFSLLTEGTGRKEGRKTGFVRVESVEVLEQADSRLDRYRNSDGDVYFYDVKAARHPSFTVNGLLVHNSSRLKHLEGATQKAVNEFNKSIPYRLLCTATAAPNDFLELGTSSEALGYLGARDMVTMFFKEKLDAGGPGWQRQKRWMLRGHAEQPFWRWVCSWARACRKPSDIGFSDERFVLPSLIEKEVVVKSSTPREGMLFATPAVGLREEREERRVTIKERCELVGELVGNHKGASVSWCHLNDEGDLLEKCIDGAKQVKGSMSDDEKEEILIAFQTGQLSKIVIKPKIGCYGLNWQHCNHITTFPSHSWEEYYQAVRRCWRFGQENPVTVDIISTEGEVGIAANLKRKADQAEVMFNHLVHFMADGLSIDKIAYGTKEEIVIPWLVSTK